MGEHEQPVWRRSATHMLHAALMLKAGVEDRLQAETGLLLADNEALLHLAAADRPLRMSDIADRLVLSRGGTTKVIDRLEAMELARRAPYPDDRRATVVEITAAGRDIHARARPVVDAALQDLWARHVTDDEAATILQAASRVLEANEEWHA